MYNGESQECPVCERVFVPGDTVNVFTVDGCEIAMCHLDIKGFSAQFLGATGCVRQWRKKQTRKYPAPIVKTIPAL
ncbi:MAG: hypothetical protein Q7R85_01685 [bacterium]|nr:hypothetical protein [bacterium]